jgi:hypothetical protein
LFPAAINGESITAALSLLAGTDALIIDLRGPTRFICSTAASTRNRRPGGRIDVPELGFVFETSLPNSHHHTSMYIPAFRRRERPCDGRWSARHAA